MEVRLVPIQSVGYPLAWRCLQSVLHPIHLSDKKASIPRIREISERQKERGQISEREIPFFALPRSLLSVFFFLRVSKGTAALRGFSGVGFLPNRKERVWAQRQVRTRSGQVRADGWDGMGWADGRVRMRLVACALHCTVNVTCFVRRTATDGPKRNST